MDRLVAPLAGVASTDAEDTDIDARRTACWTDAVALAGGRIVACGTSDAAVTATLGLAAVGFALTMLVGFLPRAGDAAAVLTTLLLTLDAAELPVRTSS